MAYKTRHVMNTILQRSFKERRADMSPMKAQKMLFFTHGWHLATTGKPAISDSFEVWQYGPVVDDIYHELKRYGSAPVSEYIKDNPFAKAYVINQDCKDIYESIDIAWEKYIGLSAVTLSTLTHEKGSPWAVAKESGKAFIPDEDIKRYFINLARTR